MLRHATGGEIPNLLPRLSPEELNVTLSVNNTGNVRAPRNSAFSYGLSVP